MQNRFIGAIFLIIGTCIGGSMLALPITTSSTSLGHTFLLMVSLWFVMTTCAFLILEVNLRLPENSNLISMAKHTLGFWGTAVTWISYLMLLYLLLSVYISGGTDLLTNLGNLVHFKTIWSLNTIIFAVIMGAIVFKGIYLVDNTNRVLMTIKLLACLLLVIFLVPHSQLQLLPQENFNFSTNIVTTIITSFGYACIIPSIRTYLNSDAKKLRLAVLIGSLIPLICYLLWIFVVQSSIGSSGTTGLLAMNNSSEPIVMLVTALTHHVGSTSVKYLSHLFVSICILTSFLGVALSLFDFLADGLKLQKSGSNGWLLITMTILPPLAIVLINKNIFIVGLSYAGILCSILLIAIPIAMAIGMWIKKSKAKHFESVC